ncbi:MAG TPA: V-type ATPase subunit [Oscillospiraceae bacterium]|nr:V-type ATPase subunit [Oscillospiraceae bacterium]
MNDNMYTYAVARIRSKELTLISKSTIEQLMACKTYNDCFQLLVDRGWGKGDEKTAEQLLASEREKTWELMEELVEDISVFNVFLYENDFHNLKASTKQVYTNTELPDVFITHGTISPDIIYKAVKEHDFTLLPAYMQKCVDEAYDVLMHTGDSQLSDTIIDKATLDTIYAKGKASKNELLELYSELKVASANIKIALRSFKTGKSEEFMERAFSPCDTLDAKRLLSCALEGEEEILSYLLTTVYADAVSAIKQSPSAFERWCDDLIIKHIRPQKHNPFTLSPLAAFILARENEIKCVRILISGKLNDLPDSSIRERLREMYV